MLQDSEFLLHMSPGAGSIIYPGAATATEKSRMASEEQGSAFTPCAGDNNDEDTRTQTGHSFCSRANDRALQGAHGEPPDHERGAQPHTGPACIGGAEGIGHHHPPHEGSRGHLEIPCVFLRQQQGQKIESLATAVLASNKLT